jgi:hypothetical protein
MPATLLALEEKEGMFHVSWCWNYEEVGCESLNNFNDSNGYACGSLSSPNTPSFFPAQPIPATYSTPQLSNSQPLDSYDPLHCR